MYKLCWNNFVLEVTLEYQKQDIWKPVPEIAFTEAGFSFHEGNGHYYGNWELTEDKEEAASWEFTLGFAAGYLTQLRMQIRLPGQRDYYHVIPCNIFGDNHAEEAKPGEFPLLMAGHKEYAFCSDRWEYRADRAAQPLSALCCSAGAAGCFIEPYADGAEGAGDRSYIRNGVFAKLPDAFGVSLGYTNDPVTMKNRSTPEPSLRDMARKAETRGIIYIQTAKKAAQGNAEIPGASEISETGFSKKTDGPEAESAGRQALHEIVRRIYSRIHVRASYQKSFREALQGLLDAFCYENYDRKAKEYTNKNCQPPDDPVLKPWRNVVEIGWTGGAVLAYPLVLARYLLGESAEAPLSAACCGEDYLDRITEGYNEKSGLFYDLMAPIDDSGSRVNGWWTGYGLVKDCHCAYTVGSALHYVLKTADFLKSRNLPYRDSWVKRCRQVLDTVVFLQREDGAFGYTYSTTEKKVLDWSGFAGCWFVPALVYLTRITGEKNWLEPAGKALDYYHEFVLRLNCFGTPMDTWKSVDQEGNLAFIRGSRLLHEATGEEKYLEYLKEGAAYEFLWRYSYPTRPEFKPLDQGWNSCGGSVTSVSNPHIHPMGVIADSDLLYLAKVTGDVYYRERALDSTAWMMQTLELYPDKTGYGRYGVLSERWCPSDGLTVQRDSRGNGYSSWYSYNLWAAANVMEAVAERYQQEMGDS